MPLVNEIITEKEKEVNLFFLEHAEELCTYHFINTRRNESYIKTHTPNVARWQIYSILACPLTIFNTIIPSLSNNILKVYSLIMTHCCKFTCTTAEFYTAQGFQNSTYSMCPLRKFYIFEKRKMNYLEFRLTVN